MMGSFLYLTPILKLQVMISLNKYFLRFMCLFVQNRSQSVPIGNVNQSHLRNKHIMDNSCLFQSKDQDDLIITGSLLLSGYNVTQHKTLFHNLSKKSNTIKETKTKL